MNDYEKKWALEALRMILRLVTIIAYNQVWRDKDDMAPVTWDKQSEVIQESQRLLDRFRGE